jgi:hypothetical protein
MSIAGVVALAIIGWLFYVLFIKGLMWPILLFAFGILGGKTLMLAWFPSSIKTAMTFMNYNISWAALIAVVITMLGVGYLMEKN